MAVPQVTHKSLFILCFCAAAMLRTVLQLTPGGCGRGCEAVRVHVCARLQGTLVRKACGILRREAARGKGRRGTVRGQGELTAFVRSVVSLCSQ